MIAAAAEALGYLIIGVVIVVLIIDAVVHGPPP